MEKKIKQMNYLYKKIQEAVGPPRMFKLPSMGIEEYLYIRRLRFEFHSYFHSTRRKRADLLI
jgi:hypothetical protein